MKSEQNEVNTTCPPIFDKILAPVECLTTRTKGDDFPHIRTLPGSHTAIFTTASLTLLQSIIVPGLDKAFVTILATHQSFLCIPQ